MSFKIAVTGVGGGVGQSILKSLYHTGYGLVGLDGEVLATGLFAVPTAYHIPYSNKPDFINAVLDICKKEKVNLLFPGLDAELMPLARHREDFKAIGTTVVVSNEEVITISDDKLQTYLSLTAIGVKVPKTELLNTANIDDIAFPVIIKQRVGGARSKNVYVVRSRVELDGVLAQIDTKKADFVVQEYIEGDEYTCGTINLEGHCKGVIVMKRTLRDGDTYKCFTVQDAVIEETVKKVVNTIKPFGACNVQLRVKDGQPYIFEINARCSGTTAARTQCGFNEPLMIADFLLKNVQPSFDIKQRSILRYWNEFVVDNEEIEKMKSGHKVSNVSHSKL